MPLDVFIKDGDAGGYHAKVDAVGNLQAVEQNHPPLETSVNAIPFGTSFSDAAGSTDLRVDGSTTPQDFFIKSPGGYNFFVNAISFLISDNNARLDQFGALTALTNGCDLLYRNNAVGEITIQGEIQTNLDLIRLGQKTGAFGSGTDAYKLDVLGSGADSYIPLLDFSETFGLPWGVRLAIDTADELIFRVNDDITGLDTFDIRAFGVLL